jgi:rhodanese-related sulfurtransferase
MQIAPDEVQRKLAGSPAPVILDVRSPQETLAEGAIEGALLIPLDQLPARLQEVPQGREIIAVCKRGMRSFNAAQWLKAAGRDAVSMTGGMDQWKALGLPVKK